MMLKSYFFLYVDCIETATGVRTNLTVLRALLPANNLFDTLLCIDTRLCVERSVDNLPVVGFQ